MKCKRNAKSHTIGKKRGVEPLKKLLLTGEMNIEGTLHIYLVKLICCYYINLTHTFIVEVNISAFDTSRGLEIGVWSYLLI